MASSRGERFGATLILGILVLGCNGSPPDDGDRPTPPGPVEEPDRPAGGAEPIDRAADQALVDARMGRLEGLIRAYEHHLFEAESTPTERLSGYLGQASDILAEMAGHVPFDDPDRRSRFADLCRDGAARLRALPPPADEATATRHLAELTSYLRPLAEMLGE